MLSNSDASTSSDQTDVDLVATRLPIQPVVSRSNGRLMLHRVNRDTEGSDGTSGENYYNANDRLAMNTAAVVRRAVNTYHHVNDGSSSVDGGGWIIGGNRRRGSADAFKHQQLLHQDKKTDEDKPTKQTWLPGVDSGSEAASSLSEVQVVVQQSPHRNNLVNDQQQQLLSDASSKWYSKRLSYATKSSPAALVHLQQQQPLTTGSNAVLLAEVLGQKSGFNTTGTDKGYYGPTTVTGSKGFQNDLMDMLGKSM